jgi:SAM-dependent methyltransferase
MASDKKPERRARAMPGGGTDVEHWADLSNFDAEWEKRSVAATDLIPAGAAVLDIGCGTMGLEGHLPPGCRYVPCDVVARDARTIVTDLNQDGLPLAAVDSADMVVMLGVWEYLQDPARIFAQLAKAGRDVVCSYCVTDLSTGRDRRAQGWLNDFSLTGFLAAAAEHGCFPVHCQKLDSEQYLFKLATAPRASAPARKRVHVVAYFNTENFGDRLGFHILNDVLPPHCEVTWGTLHPFTPVPDDLDLLVIGIGNSLFAHLYSRGLIEAAGRARATVGIFGTQFRQLWPPHLQAMLLERLTDWFARYEEDVLLYGRGQRNVHHLGDWLINAFPMTVPSIKATLKIDKTIIVETPLDRAIQTIQQYQRVHSPRLHTLLCALTSAEYVSYTEQLRHGMISGKFRSLLMDVFGRTFPAGKEWRVDRDAVAAYKAKVRRNTDSLRTRIETLLQQR